MPEDYCDLCDLPLSTCVHGMPAPAPKPPPASRVRTPARVSTPPAPRPVSRRTEHAEFRAHIVAVLRDAGTRLDTDEVMLELEIRLDGMLRERDQETSATGELRWHTAARKERKAMIDEGLIVPAQPGIWELTERGRGA